MLKKFIPKTIRGRIIVCTAGTMLFLAAFTLSVSYLVFQTFLRRNQIQSAEYNLQLISSSVGAAMDNIIYFNNWCCSSQDISQYLEDFRDQSRMPSISSQDAALRITALNTYDRLKEEYYNTHSSDYISWVLISPANRRNYLLISDTSAMSSNAADRVYQSSFFQSLYEAPSLSWSGLEEEQDGSRRLVIPMVRPIYNQYNSRILGWSYLSVSSSLISDCLKTFPLNEDSSLFVTLGGKSYQYKDNTFVETAMGFSLLAQEENSAFNSDTQVARIRLEDGSRRTMITCPISQPGWSISQILSENDGQAQRQVYMMIIAGIFCVILAMGLWLYYLLNRTVNQPAKQILGKLNAVAQGDFSADPAIEWEDEFGDIGKGINRMSENVVSLMDRKVADEKQKKDLEYQILQSQINPHFLYNTLNSIKWMATIQGASGISEMTTALSRLLKSVSKGTSAMITLRQELDLVRDYFVIQQYRYGGSISIDYQIQSEDLYDCLIHRFTLQPIIENALFHGIEPKGCAGKILVKAEAVPEGFPEPSLRISITDNGIGMTEETIHKVLQDDAPPTADFFKQVGISNVNRRIQYEFGPEYGIQIESRPGEYTTMIITLPIRRQ